MKIVVAIAFAAFAIISVGPVAVGPAHAGFADRMSGKGDFASGGHQREMRMKQMQKKRMMMRQKRG